MVDAQLAEHLLGHAADPAEEGEQDVLGADVVVAEPEGLADGVAQGDPRPRGEPAGGFGGVTAGG